MSIIESGTTKTDKYDPVAFLAALYQHLNVSTDAELSRALGLSHPTISRIRAGEKVLTSFTLLQIHEATDISIRELRNMMGDTSPDYWDGAPVPRKRSLGRVVSRS